MTCTKTATVDRPLRVQVPLLVSFESESFTVRDFTLDLSVGGILLLTDHVCPWGTVGTIKFRSSQFEEPFTISGERGSTLVVCDSPQRDVQRSRRRNEQAQQVQALATEPRTGRARKRSHEGVRDDRSNGRLSLISVFHDTDLRSNS